MTNTEDVHQFHGTTCLCGFDSHGRSRSMTEHIVKIERERIAQAIEALHYPEAVFSYEVKQDAARIARGDSIRK